MRHRDAQYFESRQFCHSGMQRFGQQDFWHPQDYLPATPKPMPRRSRRFMKCFGEHDVWFMKCFGEHDVFQQLMPFLDLRSTFKLSYSGTTLASMLKGSLVKSPRLLCQLAMEQFVEFVLGDDLYDLSAWAVVIKSVGGDEFSDQYFRLTHQEFLEIMRDFGDIFQEGHSIHQRSRRIRRPPLFLDTDRRPPAESHKQSHCALPGIGIIWTSKPICAFLEWHMGKPLCGCYMGACHDETSWKLW